MSHNENCKKCKAKFLEALKQEFGEVTDQWKSGWPCRLEDVIVLPEIKSQRRGNWRPYITPYKVTEDTRI